MSSSWAEVSQSGARAVQRRAASSQAAQIFQGWVAVRRPREWNMPDCLPMPGTGSTSAKAGGRMQYRWRAEKDCNRCGRHARRYGTAGAVRTHYSERTGDLAGQLAWSQDHLKKMAICTTRGPCCCTRGRALKSIV